MVPLQEETNSEFSNPDSNNFGNISMTITIFIASLISDIKIPRAKKFILPLSKIIYFY